MSSMSVYVGCIVSFVLGMATYHFLNRFMNDFSQCAISKPTEVKNEEVINI